MLSLCQLLMINQRRTSPAMNILSTTSLFVIEEAWCQGAFCVRADGSDAA